MKLVKMTCLFFVLLASALPALAKTLDLNAVLSQEQSGSIYLYWTPVEDATSYDIYRGGNLIARSLDPFYADRGLKAGTNYKYQVKILKGEQQIGEMTIQAIAGQPKNIPVKKKIKFAGSYFLVNGKQFIVCGISYKPPLNYDTIETDLKAIKDAGFNTIYELPDAKLNGYMAELAAKNDLMVIKNLPVSSKIDYTDEKTVAQVLKNVEEEVSVWAGHSNILAYVLMNKPEPDMILKDGLGATNDFFRKVKKTCENQDPRPVTIVNYPGTDMIGSDMLDIITTVNDPLDKYQGEFMTYRGYLNWLKRYKAKDKPLLVLTGSDSALDFTQAIGESAAGVCYINSHPEQALPKSLQHVCDLAVLSPASDYILRGATALMIFMNNSILPKNKIMEASFNGTTWLPLFNQGNLWRMELDTKQISDGQYSFKLRMGAVKAALTDVPLTVNAVIANGTKAVPEKLEIINDKVGYIAKEKLVLQFSVTENSLPKEGVKVKYALFRVNSDGQPLPLGVAKEGVTPKDGILITEDEVSEGDKKPYFLLVAASMDSPDAPGQRYNERKVLFVNP